MCEEHSLDSWTPTTRSKFLIQSEWRKKQINGKKNINPGLDDVRKIKIFLKNKYSHDDIINFFGINKKILKAIMNGVYEPTKNNKIY